MPKISLRADVRAGAPTYTRLQCSGPTPLATRSRPVAELVAAIGRSAGRILIIEDEPGILDFIERGLTDLGYQVTSAGDGVTGTARALSDDVDLVVLDLKLPGRNGLDVLTEVHTSRPTLPVILLSALDAVEQRVAGLDAGAVDYLPKPFSFAELAARIRAHLRIVAQSMTTTLRGGDIHLNLLTREVRQGGSPVHLSTTEFELLTYLVRNQGHGLTREQILKGVWGYDYDPGTNVVDVYIGYLRRKLRRADGAGSIVTIRSVGYRFDAGEEVASADQGGADAVPAN